MNKRLRRWLLRKLDAAPIEDRDAFRQQCVAFMDAAIARPGPIVLVGSAGIDAAAVPIGADVVVVGERAELTGGMCLNRLSFAPWTHFNIVRGQISVQEAVNLGGLAGWEMAGENYSADP